MDNSVPYIVYEGEQARNERTIKRLIVAVVIAVVLCVLSNAVWLYAWMQFDYTDSTEHVQLDAKDGIANYIGNNGDISNGTDSSYAPHENGDQKEW